MNVLDFRNGDTHDELDELSPEETERARASRERIRSAYRINPELDEEGSDS